MQYFLPFAVVIPMLAAVLFAEADPSSTHIDERPPNASFAEIHKLTLIIPAPAPSARAFPSTPDQSPLYLADYEPNPTPTAPPAPSERVRAAVAEGFSEAEMRALLTEAGFPEWSHATALAVMWCESHWNPSVHNTTAPDNSIGLAQINTYGTLGPDRLAKLQSLGYSVTTVDEARQLLFDPIANLRVAHLMSGGGTGWGSWSCAR